MDISGPGRRAERDAAAGPVDYAEPVSLGSRDRESGPRPVRRPWGGPGRRLLRAGCVGVSLLLAAALVVVLALDRPGETSPRAAVQTLIQGIADLDGPAIVGVVAPAEVAEAQRADGAYARLGARVLRVGEEPPAEVDRVLVAAEDQLAGAFSRRALGVLAAVDLELDALDLSVETIDETSARVYLRGGVLGVRVDPGRLPGGVDAGGGDAGSGVTGGAGPAGYDMELAEGWERDGEPITAYLVTVEVGGRWFVSLEASADDLLGER